MSTNKPSTQAVKGKVQVGDRAPLFSLSTQKGETVNLEDLIGKSAIVLFFYPKDDTPGCTAEACAFRDSYEVIDTISSGLHLISNCG
jgi:thioredoxin-dependent peroxiredoxin